MARPLRSRRIQQAAGLAVAMPGSLLPSVFRRSVARGSRDGWRGRCRYGCGCRWRRRGRRRRKTREGGRAGRRGQRGMLQAEGAVRCGAVRRLAAFAVRTSCHHHHSRFSGVQAPDLPGTDGGRPFKRVKPAAHANPSRCVSSAPCPTPCPFRSANICPGVVCRGCPSSIVCRGRVIHTHHHHHGSNLHSIRNLH